jgi:hypothetical protein
MCITLDSDNVTEAVRFARAVCLFYVITKTKTWCFLWGEYFLLVSSPVSRVCVDTAYIRECFISVLVLKTTDYAVFRVSFLKRKRDFRFTSWPHCVRLLAPSVAALNQLTDFRVTWYGRCAVEGSPIAITTRRTYRACPAGVTLAPLKPRNGRSLRKSAAFCREMVSHFWLLR